MTAILFKCGFRRFRGEESRSAIVRTILSARDTFRRQGFDLRPNGVGHGFVASSGGREWRVATIQEAYAVMEREILK